jgi:hypothetical protein
MANDDVAGADRAHLELIGARPAGSSNTAPGRQ